MGRYRYLAEAYRYMIPIIFLLHGKYIFCFLLFQKKRCGQPVYPMERLEPLPGQHYHPQCFRCWKCQTKLTLATFW